MLIDDVLNKMKALSDGNRLRIVIALSQHDELCACQLLALLKVTGATLSRHMGVLVASGLVQSRKQGRWVYYRVVREQQSLADLWAWLDSACLNDAQLREDKEHMRNICECDMTALCSQQRVKGLCDESKN